MKKILSLTLVIIFALFPLTVYGDNSVDSTQIVKSSELIALEDAARIIGATMETDTNFSDSADSFGSLRTIYNADGYMLQITIRQDSALDKEDAVDMEYLARGSISTYIRGIRGTYENAEGTIAVEGLGDWAGIVKPVGKLYSLYIVYDGLYFIEITLSGEDKDDDWEVDKLKQTGELATERLESITGVKSKPAESEASEEGGFNWLWALLIALAVIAVVGIIAFIVTKSKTQKKPHSSE